jgi:hypothetical protein
MQGAAIRLARRLAWPSLVVAVILAVLAPALGAERTLARRDSARQVRPARSLVSSALREGRLPLWNPHEGTGMPLFADGIHSVLHPVSVAGAFVAPGSVDFLLLGYLVVAGLGGLALGVSLGATPMASSAAGVAYATCGFTLSMTGNPVFLAGAATLPWLLAAAVRTGLGAPWGGVACAAATAAALAAGDAQVALVGATLGGALAVTMGGARRVLPVAVGLVAGGLLAGVQVAATWTLLGQSIRGAGLLEAERLQWAFHPARALEWIVPGLARGDLATPSGADLLGGPVLRGPFAESVYLGLPMVLLAAWGIAGQPRRMRVLLLGTLAALAWLAMGHRLGASDLLDGVPVWSRFRYAEKLVAPFSLVAAVSAALGIDRLRDARWPRWAAFTSLAVLLVAAALLAGALAAPDAAVAALAHASSRGASFLLANLRTGLVHTAIAAAALGALGRLHAGARAPAAAVVLAATTAAALPFGVHLGHQPHQQPRMVAPLEAPPPGPRLAHPVAPELFTSNDLGLDPIDTQILLERDALWPPWNVALGVDAVTAYSGFRPLRLNALETFFDRGSWWTVARRFGVTHVILGFRYRPADLAAAEAATSGGRTVFARERPPLEVWEVPHAPWASFAPAALAVPGPARALDALAALVRAGRTHTVVVETGDPVPTAAGTVLAIARGTEELQVLAESDGDGLLVVRDAYWPGWRAWIDGRETPILAADVLVRAVRWPPGRHRLVMRYEPPEIGLGLLATAMGALATLALALVARRKPRPPAGP